jgi:hypothetical protein
LREKVTRAIPGSLLIGDIIITMLAMKRGSKIQKKNAAFLSRVSPGFFNLADKARLHEVILPYYYAKVNLLLCGAQDIKRSLSLLGSHPSGTPCLFLWLGWRK